MAGAIPDVSGSPDSLSVSDGNGILGFTFTPP
jgi:hypothetical protein